MSAPAPDPLLVPIEDVNEDFTERTPLLHRTKSKEKGVTPLPKLQLGIVCLIRIVEPICFQVIFPFISEHPAPSGGCRWLMARPNVARGRRGQVGR